jgi:hypothetical protein
MNSYPVRSAKAARVARDRGDRASRREEAGRYVYGVVACDRVVGLGWMGIDGHQVYTLPHRDISAVVHACSTRPYQSADSQVVEGWVKAHQVVLDIARRKFGTVVPASFDTILRPGDSGASPEQAVTDWLTRDYERLQALIKKIEGKDEYGVQISYEPDMLVRSVSESAEVKVIRSRIASGSEGTAYLCRKKLEAVIKKDTERLADAWFRDFYDRIKNHADDIVVEKTSQLEDGREMLLNLSCLVSRRKVNGLGKELEEIDDIDGFAVRFTGPWPTYSFVPRPVVAVPGEPYAAHA